MSAGPLCPACKSTLDLYAVNAQPGVPFACPLCNTLIKLQNGLELVESDSPVTPPAEPEPEPVGLAEPAPEPEPEVKVETPTKKRRVSSAPKRRPPVFSRRRLEHPPAPVKVKKSKKRIISAKPRPKKKR